MSKLILISISVIPILAILLFFIEVVGPELIQSVMSSRSQFGIEENPQIISMNTSELPQDHFGTTESLLPEYRSEEGGKQELNPVGHEINFLPVEFLEKGYQLQKAVAIITNSKGNGTGFLISPSILLTNNHVISNPIDAMKSTFSFNFQTYPNESSGSTDIYTANTSIFHTSPQNEKDFTIIKLNGNPGSKWGYIQLPRDTFEEQLAFLRQYWGTPIHANIIQHPDGRLKEVALQDNILTNVSKAKGYLRYTTDTESGASGAPVFDNQWNLIALHHANGDKVTVSESPTIDGTRGFYIQKEITLNNEGILASAIVDDLLKHYDDSQEGIRILKELGIDMLVLQDEL